MAKLYVQAFPPADLNKNTEWFMYPGVWTTYILILFFSWLLVLSVFGCTPGTAWTVVPTPNAGDNGDIFRAVSAASSTDVWAVGDYFLGSADLTLTEPLVVESESTSPADIAVDYYRADVSAVLDDPQTAKAERPERNDLRACFTQAFRVVSAERPCAERIIEQEDSHTGLGTLREYLGKSLGYLTGQGVVHLDGDGGLGISQISPESRKNGAIANDLDLIPAKQVPSGEQRDSERECVLARGDRGTVDANAAYLAYGGAPRDVQEAYDCRDQNHSDKHPVEKATYVMNGKRRHPRRHRDHYQLITHEDAPS